MWTRHGGRGSPPRTRPRRRLATPPAARDRGGGRSFWAWRRVCAWGHECPGARTCAPGPWPGTDAGRRDDCQYVCAWRPGIASGDGGGRRGPRGSSRSDSPGTPAGVLDGRADQRAAQAFGPTALPFVGETGLGNFWKTVSGQTVHAATQQVGTLADQGPLNASWWIAGRTSDGSNKNLGSRSSRPSRTPLQVPSAREWRRSGRTGLV